jgi:hypothetical protein
MSEYTKGEWRIDIWDYPTATPPRKELQVISATNLLATFQCDFSGDNPYTVPKAEAEANARLFVASHDLLEALRDACLTYAVHGDQPPDKWLAAIAKAERGTL